MKIMNTMDIFSGIGGFSLGLERTGGFKTVAFGEIDVHCHKVLKKHWPEVPIFKDVSKLKYDLTEKIDVICGGFPCTDISVAGKQKGLKDEKGNATRSGLWFEYARIIGEIRPRYVIIENVAALRGNGLVRVLQDLWAIGYDAEWEIISAASVGAPHLRERIWIVAYPNSTRLERSNVSSSSSTNQKKTFANNGPTCKRRENLASDSDDFRFWPTFASEKEKSEWWTETTLELRSRWEIMPNSSGVDNGLSGELEQNRKQRIKQLGNSIVPAIAEIIGKQILNHEAINGN